MKDASKWFQAQARDETAPVDLIEEDDHPRSLWFGIGRVMGDEFDRLIAVSRENVTLE